MQVTAKQVHNKAVAKYTMWDGEMCVTVYLGYDYRLVTAVVVVNICSGRVYARQYSECCETNLREEKVYEWIAEQLTELSTGKMLAEGTSSDIKGLRKAK